MLDLGLGGTAAPGLDRFLARREGGSASVRDTQKSPTDLTRDKIDNRYSLLYYQFVKNAFGLCHRDKEDGDNVYLRIYFDEIPAGTTESGKRTIAKEKLFYHILSHIRNLKGYENFEIYCDTPAESAVDYWRHPYRHWQFLANEFRNQSGV